MYFNQALESSKDQASIKELQRLLDKVEEMRKQRIMLYNQLRDAIQSDDITKLTTHQTDLESLFSQVKFYCFSNFFYFRSVAGNLILNFLKIIFISFRNWQSTNV